MKPEDREKALKGLHKGANPEKTEARVLKTLEKVNRHTAVRDRLRAAMEDLLEDTRETIADGTKEQQLEAVATFEANLDHWLDMFAPRKGK